MPLFFDDSETQTIQRSKKPNLSSIFHDAEQFLPMRNKRHPTSFKQRMNSLFCCFFFFLVYYEICTGHGKENSGRTHRINESKQQLIHQQLDTVQTGHAFEILAMTMQDLKFIHTLYTTYTIVYKDDSLSYHFSTISNRIWIISNNNSFNGIFFVSHCFIFELDSFVSFSRYVIVIPIHHHS